MDKLPPPAPLSLSGNVSLNWKRFKQKFELYLEATGAAEKSDKTQTSILLHVIGEDALDLYNTFKWDIKDGEGKLIEDQNMKLNHVMSKFEGFCSPKSNQTYERHKFFTCSQQTGESFDHFVTELKTRAKNCDFNLPAAELEASLIRDQIVRGITDNTVREKLLRVSDLNLDQAIQICKAADIVRVQAAELSSTASGHQVNVVQKPGKRVPFKRPGGTPTPTTPQPKGSTVLCERCGYKKHDPGRRCPALGKTCARCQGKNHFAKMCETKNVNAVSDAPVDLPEESDFVIDSVRAIDWVESDWIQLIKINDCLLPCKLDTGAQANILSEEDIQKLPKKPKLHQCDTKLKGYYGSDIPVLGKCVVNLQLRGKTYPVRFVVVPGSAPTILGKNACEKLDLVKRIYTLNQSRKHDMLTEYKDVFEGLGCLPGEVSIKIQPNAEPVIEACRGVPFKLQDKLKEELKRMTVAGIIKPVEEPTEWVHALHIVHKPNGQLRVCLDPRNLNRVIKREHFKLPTREEIMSKFAGCKYFSKLDATKGFWQMSLDESSSKLCTFITPFGRYQYLRLPFGISSAPEIYHRTIHNYFSHMDYVETSMDDLIIGADTMENHDKRLREILDICRERGLKLNPDKCVIGVTELVFIGDVLSDKGVKPDPSKVAAIREFPVPKSKEEVLRFLGMIKYLARFLPELSSRSYHLRSLLKKDVHFLWIEAHEKEFEDLKNLVSQEPILQYYDPNLPIKISADASMRGLGAILQQQHGEDWKPVAFASRSVTEAESRYATIERETLAIEFACTKFHQYIYGQPVLFETDHKPLAAIFSKALNDCPPRIQRMRLKLQKYALMLRHIPGKQMITADTLSRGPISSRGPDVEGGQPQEVADIYTVVSTLASYPVWEADDPSRAQEIESQCEGLISKLPITDRKKEEIRAATAKDKVLQALQKVILDGWPENRNECPKETQDFWNYRDELCVQNGFLLKGSRIIIPRSLRSEILDKIHTGHLGMEKCKRRAKISVFWPGISNDIENCVGQCQACLENLPAQAPEPLRPHSIPTGPLEKVGVDLAVIGNKNLLVIVDYYTNFPYVYEVGRQTAQVVISAMRHFFSNEGVPYEVFTDNGPCFACAEFREFSITWDFRHQTSSPMFPQSNGLAESAVKIVKNIFRKCAISGEDPYMGLLNYRATPLASGLSPAQLSKGGRNLRSNLPVIHRPLSTPEGFGQKRADQKIRQKWYHDLRGSRALPALRPGDTVRMRNQKGKWTEKAVVTEEVAPRSYHVKTLRGSEFRRNRRDLLKTQEQAPVEQRPFEVFQSLGPAQMAQSDVVPTDAAIPSEAAAPEVPLSMDQDTPPLRDTSSTVPSLAEGRTRRVVNKPTRLIETC